MSNQDKLLSSGKKGGGSTNKSLTSLFSKKDR